MPEFMNLTGMVFGRLTVIERAANQGAKTMWRCRCECGKETRCASGHLRRGKIVSCGCFHVERVTKHGGFGSPEHQSWQSMKARCLNPNAPKYDRYGGRGIGICPAWVESFEAFLRDMGPRPSKLHTLDRIDNNKDYGPDNCRWATKKEQSNNRNDNHRYEYRGRALTLPEWARETGVEYELIRSRIRLGWDVATAIETPRDEAMSRVAKRQQAKKRQPVQSTLF